MSAPYDPVQTIVGRLQGAYDVLTMGAPHPSSFAKTIADAWMLLEQLSAAREQLPPPDLEVDLRAQIMRLHVDLDKARAAIGPELRGQLEELTAQRDTMRRDIERGGAALRKREAWIAERDVTILELKAEIAKLKEANASMFQDLCDASKVATEHEANILELRAEITKFKQSSSTGNITVAPVVRLSELNECIKIALRVVDESHPVMRELRARQQAYELQNGDLVSVRDLERAMPMSAPDRSTLF